MALYGGFLFGPPPIMFCTLMPNITYMYIKKERGRGQKRENISEG